ncbi:cytochrome o ubiquinol oxidase subunit IV [Dyella flava]|uniref:Cytochrome bo(3) ubiquinol oxidase subunit 4 n=1 Tax=Dyella flava TaxID=1920170 RepID=A0ABS2JY19_9GAMM|nr:cytochrome o ubiquinol oxidase subunit IV [Dyella flava]MBM7123891.1 cytochrome o ubiquinol oxidase subunit IV [Dyella flava]GLQ52582.1 cytochrome o ubiquinol oxidase subunit IV [Dyella flava]
MSTSLSHHATAHAHADAEAHGDMKSYFIGFVLSLALTAASFGTVMSPIVPHAWRLGSIVALCVAQLLVQLSYFLHLGTAKSQAQNTAIFVCTGFLIAVVVAGSLWVMHNADVNMMPDSMSVQAALHHV